MPDLNEDQFTVINKKICRDCGAEYSSGSAAASMHTRSQGHSGFKNKKVKVPKVESKISYQPGYGPGA